MNTNATGGHIAYEVRGNGYPVVFIHAGYLDSRMWDRPMERFSARYRAIRYDVRGFGSSGRAEGTYSDAEDLRALLDLLGVRRAVLAGVSNGGRIALDFAVEHPDRVAAMVLMDFGIRGYEESGPDEAALWESTERTDKEIYRLVGLGKHREAATMAVDLWTPAVSARVREWLIPIAEKNLHSMADEPAAVQSSPDPPAFRRLDVLKMPILMMLGERDVPGAIAMVRRVHSMVPGAQLVELIGADHVPSLSRPEEFERIVASFLEDHADALN